MFGGIEMKKFKTESQKILDMMINSIYTHKEIFIREILSNASDAIDKLYYKSLTDGISGLSREDFAIEIKADKEARTLTVTDNGIGMTAEELDSNLGVIAKSGSQDFKNNNEQKEVLTKAGFCAIGISANGWHYDCIETLNQWLKTLTEVFKYDDNIKVLSDRSEKAQKKSNEIYAMIKERVKDLTPEQKKRVFFLFQYNDSTILTSGKNFFGQWWYQCSRRT